MVKVIVTGHGGYATAVQGNLKMLLGDTPGFYYVDFNPEDNLQSLDEKLAAAVAQCGESEILFACDLAGGSTFRQSAVLCIPDPEKDVRRMAVAGLNAAAYAEMVYNLDLPLKELADLAMETTRSTIVIFPGPAE